MVEWICQQNGRMIICCDQYSVCYMKVRYNVRINGDFF